MIKKTVVCDRCEKGKPWVIIPKSERLPDNEVFCRECADYYYNIEYDIRCVNCGEFITAGQGCRSGLCMFCSPICAIQHAESHNEYDEQKARYFTSKDENMLLGEDEEDD